MTYSTTVHVWCVCVCIWGGGGLVFLLIAVCLLHRDGFLKKGRTGVAAQGQQSRHGSEERVDGDNRPQLIWWNSVRERSAGVKGRSDVAPLGLREQWEKVNVIPSVLKEYQLLLLRSWWMASPEPQRLQRRRSSPTSSCIQGCSGHRWRLPAVAERRTNTPASAAKISFSFLGFMEAGSTFLQTDHNTRKADWVFEVGLVLVNVGETRVQRTIQRHLEWSRSYGCVSSSLRQNFAFSFTHKSSENREGHSS